MQRRSTPAYGGASCKPSGALTFKSMESASYDPGMPKRGRKLPKSTAGLRTTLLPNTLRTFLDLPTEPDALVFGRTATEPFTPSHVRKQADAAWTAVGVEAVGLHECRHAFSSFLDAAGISPDRADRYMGKQPPRCRLSLSAPAGMTREPARQAGFPLPDLTGAAGLEPATPGFGDRCSAS